MIKQNQARNSNQVSQKEYESVLIGKAWVKADGRFSIVPLTEPVKGKKGEFTVSEVYPLPLTDYTRVTFGINKNRDESKNHCTHYVFLNIEKDRMADYEEICAKIGQTVEDESK